MIASVSLEFSNLKTIDLDFEEELTTEEAKKVAVGLVYKNGTLGDERGCWYPRLPTKYPTIKPPICLPQFPTLALVTEDGYPYLDLTTLNVIFSLLSLQN